MLDVRRAVSPAESAQFTAAQRRDAFLVSDLFAAGEVHLVYACDDRMVLGGTAPVPGQPVRLQCPAELRAASFCERREIGIVNVGDPGVVQAGSEFYQLGPYDCLYVGRGTGDIAFASDGPGRARFYLVSTPAHGVCPTTVIHEADVKGEPLGSLATASVRTLRKYIHPDGVRSCQLVLGATTLEAGSVWNTTPPHTHGRRTEIYFYCGLPADGRVVHLMGQQDEVRPIIVANAEAVIAPGWSVHCGAGTSAYTFVWAMGGENQAFDDVDPVAVADLR
jgi:4-deoxy-L-threo-5-hexosulose-uronate ketol-isomerase